VSGLEDCDDGNIANGDGCNSMCQPENGAVCMGSMWGPSTCFAGSLYSTVETFEDAAAMGMLWLPPVTSSGAGAWTQTAAARFGDTLGLQIKAADGARYVTWSERPLGTLQDKRMFRAMVKINSAISTAHVPLFFVFQSVYTYSTPQTCLESSCAKSAYVVRGPVHLGWSR
jgi:cysteine-rich repeat protein